MSVCVQWAENSGEYRVWCAVACWNRRTEVKWPWEIEFQHYHYWWLPIGRDDVRGVCDRHIFWEDFLPDNYVMQMVCRILQERFNKVALSVALIRLQFLRSNLSLIKLKVFAQFKPNGKLQNVTTFIIHRGMQTRPTRSWYRAGTYKWLDFRRIR